MISKNRFKIQKRSHPTKFSCEVCGVPVPRGQRKSREPGTPVYCKRHAVWKRPNKGEVITTAPTIMVRQR